MNPIYIVRAKSSSNSDPIVGYATGEERDIIAYYDDVKQYGLYLEPLTLVSIPKGYADKKQALVDRKKQLENEIREINIQIKETSKC